MLAQARTTPSSEISIQEVIREALRKAAMAPTAEAALDLTGDALERIAEMAGGVARV